jgi:cytochrome c oxidase assembly protein subunit 15
MIALPRAFVARRSRVLTLGSRARVVAVWLFIVAAFVYLMVVVGGATRLTGSGLSITEWRPVSGALPPLSDGAWAEMFRKYRATSQFRLINQGISLDEFKVLFWWEWAHRLLARWVGVVFIAPFATLLCLGAIPRRLIGRCFALLMLGGLQGLVGWWMVESGLEGRASVAPERLAAHLGLALFLLGALIWTGLEAWSGQARPSDRARTSWRWVYAAFAAAIFLQCLMGALVAGGGGGRVDTDWPLMGGRLLPDDYWRVDPWTTIAHSPAAAQFNHRLMAYGLLAWGVLLVVVAARRAPRAVAGLCLLVAALLMAQAALGVATLLAGDPPSLALAHQANAALLLGSSAALAWRARRA